MRGLIICHILPADRHSVNMIVHQARNPIRRGKWSREDHQITLGGFIIIDTLLSPVSENIGLQGRGIFNEVYAATISRYKIRKGRAIGGFVYPL